MKIKEQTRKLAVGCSKHYVEVVDETDEVSSKHCFEVVDRTDEVSNHTYGKATLTWFEEIFEEYYFIVGKSNTSRIVVVSVRSMQRRSIPIPKPPVGGIPYSRASM